MDDKCGCEIKGLWLIEELHQHSWKRRAVTLLTKLAWLIVILGNKIPGNAHEQVGAQFACAKTLNPKERGTQFGTILIHVICVQQNFGVMIGVNLPFSV